MRFDMKNLAVILGAAALGSCMAGPPQTANADAQQRLAQLLAGKAAQPSSCIPQYRASSPALVAPTAIAFEVNPSLVYVSDVAGTGCEGLSGPNYTLITKSYGASGLCSGDVVQIVDHSSGQMMGSCSLGPITAYRQP
jgi:hypothetical protein